MDIQSCQIRVHELIGSVGGYWPPLAAVVRVLEELGEVFADADGKSADLASELADLFIIILCLANQYRIEPRIIPSSHTSIPRQHALGMLLQRCGDIARIVNALEGVKPKKDSDESLDVDAAFSKCLEALLLVFNTTGESLPSTFEKTVSTKATRDTKRFQERFDPTTSRVLDRFSVIRESTRCPFAAKATLWGGPEWDTSASLEANVETLRPHLDRFVLVNKYKTIDGFVWELASHEPITGVKELAAKFRHVVTLISDDVSADIGANRILDKSWQLTYNGLRMFVIVFSDIYDHLHTRTTYGQPGHFVLFQPEASFDQMEIARFEKEEVRDAIRRRFEQSGYDYHTNIQSNSLEAPRYIKPKKSTDGPVRWWEEV